MQSIEWLNATNFKFGWKFYSADTFKLFDNDISFEFALVVDFYMLKVAPTTTAWRCIATWGTPAKWRSSQYFNRICANHFGTFRSHLDDHVFPSEGMAHKNNLTFMAGNKMATISDISDLYFEAVSDSDASFTHEESLKAVRSPLCTSSLWVVVESVQL
jgi:hypothetical protein